MTQFEKFQEVLREMGVAFELTDDSEEYDFDEIMADHDNKLNTAVVIEDNDKPIVFLFRKDGSFKEVIVF